MAVLERFTVPGGVSDSMSSDLPKAWHELVTATLRDQTADFPQLYDPTQEDTPADALLHRPAWHAFPASLNRRTASSGERNALSDADRDNQDEYCEWSVERSGDDIVKVTFTTEVREYYSTLATEDPDALLNLYRRFVSTDVQLDDLFAGGQYDPNNAWNSRTDGPIMHLCQANNNLVAAIVLAAHATVLRERDGVPITNQQDLVACGKLGNPFRNSDPQIAAAINGLAATGAKLTLEDPVGLYIDRLEMAGMQFPEGVDPGECWVIERGAPGQAVRARFELPSESGSVSDVRIGGTPIRSGAQLADRISIRLGARSHSPGSFQSRVAGCVS